MTAIEELLHRNAHRPEKGPGELSHQPTLRVAVLTCMDARLDLGALFGLQPARRTCSATRAAPSPTT